jgi:hypothetical protein
LDAGTSTDGTAVTVLESEPGETGMTVVQAETAMVNSNKMPRRKVTEKQSKKIKGLVIQRFSCTKISAIVLDTGLD